MPIHKQHNLLFIHIPKTAGGSIEKALGIYGSKNEGYNFIDQSILYGYRQVMPYNWREYQATASSQNRQLVKLMAKINGWKKLTDLPVPLQHLTYSELNEHIDPHSFFSFSFVRNPFERLVSEFFWLQNNGTQKHHDFDEFIAVHVVNNHLKDRHLLPQHLFIADNKKKLLVNFLGKFEKLNEDFENLTDQLGIHAQLPNVHVSNKYDYRDYYSSQSKEIVTKLYQTDLDLFHYSY